MTGYLERVGLFDRFKRKSGGSPPSAPTFQLAMVMLREARFDAQQYVAALGDRFPLLGPATELESEQGAGGMGVTTLAVAGGTVTFALMPMPIPGGDTTPAIEASPRWEDAKTAASEHRAHLIVTVQRPNWPPPAQALLLTRVIAAIADAAPVLGIYWGSASQLHEPGEFLNRALTSTAEEPPVDLWISILPAQAAGAGLILSTLGMAALGSFEIEAPANPKNLGDAFNRVGAFATYLLVEPREIRSGDTFGFTAEDKTRIHVQPSQYDPRRSVYWLALK